jgi:NADH-quinone oxidoreductase subunit N
MNGFNLAATNISWPAVLPLIDVAVGAVIVLLIGVRVEDEDSDGLGWLSIACLAVAFVLTLGQMGSSGSAFSGAIAIDNFAVFFDLVILFAAAMTILISLSYASDNHLPGAEYYSLILFAALGMMLMAASDDLIVIFLGLETMSISVYVLAGLKRNDTRSNEAAIKYFLLGAFSTGFLLYGIALFYGATGSIKLDAIRGAIPHGPVAAGPMLLVGLGMLLIGFGFKVAAVPFHMWTPDAYEGAPTPITAYMAVGVKLAAFAAFLRVFLVNLSAISADWSMVLWVIAALSMTTGNLIAVVQTNIKRMLAYSAIAHAGYIMVAMAAAVPAAGSAILYYLVAYAFSNLGAFAVITAVESRGEPHDLIADFRGLSTRQPLLAAAMAIFLLSLTGVPPLVGFMGKFYIFSSALNAGLVWLVVIAVLNSVMAAYYYVYVIVAMYMQEGGVAVASIGRRPGLVAAITIALIGTIVVGIYPAPYMTAAQTAFNSALSGRGLIHAASLLP